MFTYVSHVPESSIAIVPKEDREVGDERWCQKELEMQRV